VSVDGLRTELVALLPRLRRFARALAREAAIERALTHAGQLRAGAPIAAWLFGILRNAWIDEQRVRARRGRLLAPGQALEEVADAYSAPADSLAVQDAVARLPDEQRLAVALVMVEGLSYKEAAHVMEVPIGTLTSRLARAREALQAMLGEQTEPGR
jgi:RNA polymerase sigma-70 factor, ECF subfamily